MSPSVVCRGCGRRLKLPPGSAGKKARCPKCGAKFDPSTPDPEATQYIPTTAAPNTEPPLSLDDEEPALSLDDAEPANGPPAAAPPPVFPPPFRFAVEVLSDSTRKLQGALAVVLTPHGLFLEAVAAQPFLFAPVGTKAESAAPGELTLTLADRVLTLRFGGVANPRLLADDTATFLAGQRPVPDPDDYRRPWWLLGVGAALALGLAAVPVALTQTSDLRLGLGLLLGGLFAGLALAANTGIALFSSLPTGGKVGAMAGVCVGILAVFLVVLGLTAPPANPQRPAERPADSPATPAAQTPTPPPPSGPAEPHPDRPPSHLDLAAKNGMSRLDDGPAEVTALAAAPRDDTVVIGYADGQTRLWSPDQPTFEALPAGPRADGPVQRIQFDNSGRYLYLTCPGGVVAAARDGRGRTPVKIPGDPVAVFVDPNRDRFLAIRGGKAMLRYVPTELIRNPPASKTVKGFVIPAPGPKGDEVFPAGVKVDYNLPGPLTFLAWHPTGKVLAGLPDGAIVTWPLPGPKSEPVTRVHKAPVRAWATAAGTWDFATGDDHGLVAVWPNKSLSPRTFGDGATPITQLAFDSWGLRLAVADTDGELGVWDSVGRELLFQVRRPTPVKAMAFGPTDDFLLIGDGKGVEVWSVEALAKK
jgi:hypothetical protein